ncbi:unnamed protein product [Clonostachys rosea]|uniref:Mid2 domain-containing protein n=1 Tax=Bionectria ochroleuca TaxID=29856 RepID=A0ABY6TRF6_BIOOC|nr:unnamed protein product [Clonostachys rosea]
MKYLFLGTRIFQALICFILLFGATSQASAPTITPPPKYVYQRQDNEKPNFVGYIPFGNGFDDTQTCAGGSTYYTWSRWAGCVTNEADLYTACTNTSVILVPTGKGTCSTSMTCGSGLIYDNPTDSTALAYIRCFSGTARPTYYRQKQSTTIKTIYATTTTFETTSTTFETTSTSNVYSGLGSDGNKTSFTFTVVSGPTAPQSLAWIAGPVVGGLAGIAIIALLAWIAIILRKRNSYPQAPWNQPTQLELAAKPENQAQLPQTRAVEQPSTGVSINPPEDPRTPPFELDNSMTVPIDLLDNHGRPPYELEHVSYEGHRHPGA